MKREAMLDPSPRSTIGASQTSDLASTPLRLRRFCLTLLHESFTEVAASQIVTDAVAVRLTRCSRAVGSNLHFAVVVAHVTAPAPARTWELADCRGAGRQHGATAISSGKLSTHS